MFITAENFEDERIAHGFFGRRGGLSSGLYGSLNCGFGTKDDPQATRKNRAAVCDAIGMEARGLLTLYQIHSAVCVPVKEIWRSEDRPQGDAMVTDVPGRALGILTADCAPVLFYGKKDDGSPVIGAAHAGWGGAVKGVLEATVSSMQGRGAIKGTIRAAVGPCIAPESYEVSEGFEAPFITHDPASARFFSAGKRPGHQQFDLPGYVVWRLGCAGIPAGAAGKDTYAREADYFSYRRSVHRAEPDYGRQISVIAIRE